MTNPFHAIDVKSKGRYYRGCQDTCPLGPDPLISVTNAQGVVAKPALVPAAVKVTAETAWARLPEMVAYSRQAADGPCAKKRVADRCGHCRFCLTAAIKAEHRNQWDTKADFGSLVHTHAYAENIGQPMPHDPDVAPFIGQYRQFLTDFGISLDRDVEFAELTVFDRQRGYAGTGDIGLHLPRFGPRGRKGLVLVDIKTSLTKPANATYPDQELQLAGLRYAPHGVMANDEQWDMPKFHGAALLNLRRDSYALIPLPADKSAYQAFLAAVTLQRFFHDQDTKAWTPLHPTPVTPPAVARKAS